MLNGHVLLCPVCGNPHASTLFLQMHIDAQHPNGSAARGALNVTEEFRTLLAHRAAQKGLEGRS